MVSDLVREITALWQTDELRRRRPSPLDGVCFSLISFIHLSLFHLLLSLVCLHACLCVRLLSSATASMSESVQQPAAGLDGGHLPCSLALLALMSLLLLPSRI